MADETKRRDGTVGRPLAGRVVPPSAGAVDGVHQPLRPVHQEEKQYQTGAQNDGEGFETVQPDEACGVAVPQNVQGHDSGQSDEEAGVKEWPDTPENPVLVAAVCQNPGHQRAAEPARAQGKPENHSLKRQNQKTLQRVAAAGQELFRGGPDHNLSRYQKKDRCQAADSQGPAQKHTGRVVESIEPLSPATRSKQ